MRGTTTLRAQKPQRSSGPGKKLRMRDPHFAVLGAGLAGVTLSSTLLARGFSVSLFERSHQAGGRMSTRLIRGEDGMHTPCDHGAQYFTARNPEFQERVQSWVERGWAVPWLGRIAADAAGEAGPADQPFAGIRLLEANEVRFVGYPHMMSPVQQELAGLLEPSPASAANGAGRLTWLPAHKLLKLRLHESTDKTGTGTASKPPVLRWMLDFELSHGQAQQSSRAFDALLLALPRPQFEALFEDSEARPCLPAEWFRDWDTTRMRACWALMLGYSRPIDLPFDGLFCKDPRASWLCRNTSKPGRGDSECWVVHGAPAWSEAHLASDHAWIVEELESVMRGYGAPAASVRLLHRWRYASCEGRAPQDAYWDPERRVGVCGDWLLGGRVEGAWLSARALAEKIAL